MKKIFGLAAIVAMVAVAGVRLSSNNNEELTALRIENMEFLAEAEGGGGFSAWYCTGLFGSCSNNSSYVGPQVEVKGTM